MKNVEKLKEVIKNDCEIQFHYCDAEGKTCAIGGLLLAAGVTKEELMIGETKPIAHNDDDLIKAWRELLTQEYGLSDYQLFIIQNCNDEIDDLETRRQAILKEIEGVSE